MSGDVDDHHAKGETRTDVGQRLRHFIEPERPIDVNLNVAGHALLRDWFEVRRPLLDDEQPEAPTSEPTQGRTHRHDSDQRPGRPTDTPVSAVANQRDAIPTLASRPRVPTGRCDPRNRELSGSPGTGMICAGCPRAVDRHRAEQSLRPGCRGGSHASRSWVRMPVLVRGRL